MIEAKEASGKDIEHHKGAKRGEIKPEDVTTIYYEPNGVATTPKDVQRELVKMKAKFPNAKFVEVESIEDENGENQLHIVPYPIVTGKQIGRASCRERVSSPV